ncbi:type I-E CRISPR-associated protein Cas6/Cse3/CasE [Zobellella iuensis]|uniref:Type I-E CRISPR-associated protein Cas6/Cse3/CasE n=1 Tax=Zobellella iuensis TaxID=2803811 RepID=A0ABS1QNJ3_9GAMM|nr:type I-E CRISPR-associated protein Cas6/Cse3/CasE [Zobellella iuensis]MBL1376435.1 type I-E CRISPR-associated protein Cas6/Cse3/CasE [Zobellella iuensis]
MYLSRITLGNSQAARAELVKAMGKGVYGHHQLLWHLFTSEKKRGFLFRHEQSDGRLAPSGEPLFYVLSKEKPDNTEQLFQVESRSFSPQLKPGDELGFQLRVNPTVCRQGKRHDVLMDAQQHWLFKEAKQLSLSAVGTKKQLKHQLLDLASDEDINRWKTVIEGGGYRGELASRLGRQVTIDLALKTISEQALLAWWQQRSRQMGIRCLENDDRLQADGYMQHDIKGKQAGAMFSSVNLCGTLVVDEPDVFLASLYQGVGRAKAFGCGLMMIRRV